MKLTQESLLGLKRHFLGALSEPSHIWLVPAPGPHLLVTSSGPLRRGDHECVVDFGTVESPGRQQTTLRVANLGSETLMVELQEMSAWLTARWLGTESKAILLTPDEAGKELDLTAEYDILDEMVLHGSVHLFVEDLSGNRRSENIGVRLATSQPRPVGRYTFNGSPDPQPFDFGVLNPAAPEADVSYTLTFQNLTSVPLIVSFADLPAWLVFEVDGFERRGPAAGRFFERARLRDRHGLSEPPFQVSIRPIPTLQFMGHQESRIELRTNDARPAFQTVDLRFSARIETPKPFLRVTPPERLSMTPVETSWAEALLENWGQTPARISLKNRSPSLEVAELPEVPAALDGQPGRATLWIRITPVRLSPGSHGLSVTLGVEEGEPPEVTVPVWVNVISSKGSHALAGHAAQPSSRFPAEIASGILFAILLLLLFIAFYFEKCS